MCKALPIYIFLWAPYHRWKQTTTGNTMWRNITTILGTRRADMAMLPQVSTMSLCLTVVSKWWLTSLMSSGTNRPWSLKAKLLTPGIILTIETHCGLTETEEQMWVSVPLVPRIDEHIYWALNCSSKAPLCKYLKMDESNRMIWKNKYNRLFALCALQIHTNNNSAFITNQRNSKQFSRPFSSGEFGIWSNIFSLFTSTFFLL